MKKNLIVLLLLLSSIFEANAQELDAAKKDFKKMITEISIMSAAADLCGLKNDIRDQMGTQARLLYKMGGTWAEMGELQNTEYSSGYNFYAVSLGSAVKANFCDNEKTKHNLVSDIYHLQNRLFRSNLDLENKIKTRDFVQDVSIKVLLGALGYITKK